MDKSDFVPDKKYFVQADGQGNRINLIYSEACCPKHLLRSINFQTFKKEIDITYFFGQAITVNPQKVVRLSFPTLVFLVRLSFEAFHKLLRLGKIFLPQMKDLDTRISKIA